MLVALFLTCLTLTGVAYVSMVGIGKKKIIPPSSDVLATLGPPTSQKLGPGPWTVLVWNVAKGKENGFAEAFPRTRQVDLVLLQEYMGDAATERVLLEGAESRRYAIATSFIYQKSGARSGTAIGSVAEAESTGFQVTSDVEPLVNTPKTTLYSTFLLPSGLSLLVLSLHGRNRGGLEPFQKQLRDLAPVIQGHQVCRALTFPRNDFQFSILGFGVIWRRL
jgi:endonuclease/exonuclease/phosphatase (EEP) superfamily protein YafD